MLIAAATAATTVDLSPIVTPIIDIAGTVLTVLASWAAYKIAQMAHISTQSALAKTVLSGVDNAISYGQAMATADVAKGLSINVQNATAAHALNYMVSHFPDAQKLLGMTDQHLADIITAKLPTPPAT